MKTITTLFLFGLLALPVSVIADLQYCNNTDIELLAAVGEFDNEKYMSTGWFFLPPQSCRIVLRKQLSYEIYWAFAVNPEKSYKTAGTEKFCISNREDFNQLNRTDNCDNSHQQREAFVPIQVYYSENYRVDFLGKEGDISAAVTSTREIDNRSANGGPWNEEQDIGGGPWSESSRVREEFHRQVHIDPNWTFSEYASQFLKFQQSMVTKEFVLE